MTTNTHELIEALEQALTDHFCDEGEGGAAGFIELLKVYGLAIQPQARAGMSDRKQIPLSEAVALYGHAIVKFDSYYKYSFTFAGPHENKHLEITVGGGRDEIYRETIKGDPVLAKEILEHWFYKTVEVTEQETRILIWSF